MNILKEIFSSEHKPKYFDYFCAAGFVFILILNYGLKVRFGMNILFLILFALTIVLRQKGWLLFKDWIIPMLLFYFYEYARAHAYELSQTLNRSLAVESLVDFERNVFFFLKDIPTVVLQDVINPVLSSPQIYDYILLMFYAVFFWGWALAGLFIWYKNRKMFSQYAYGLVIFSLFSVVIFAIFPSAPPWYASEVGIIEDVDRVMWEFEFIPGQDFKKVNEYGQNNFAAVPSLHTGWTLYMALFLTKLLGKKGLIFFIVPAGVAFSTWYGAEHYVVDSIIGGIFAIIAFYIAINWDKVREMLFPKTIPSKI